MYVPAQRKALFWYRISSVLIAVVIAELAVYLSLIWRMNYPSWLEYTLMIALPLTVLALVTTHKRADHYYYLTIHGWKHTPQDRTP